jgi:3-oxoacyl-[acyl-carrier protein] reductase/2-[hydroxy(phenyl)methyl]-succinyl-CoA dehydrogenase BbsC subunit
MNGIEDRVAVVVGIDEIGVAITLSFVEGDAKVVVCDIDQNKVNSIVEKIKEKGRQAIGFALNPAKPEEVKETIDKITEELGVIDILVNNVEDSEGFKIADMSDDRWSNSVAKNLNAAVYFCREIVPGMCKNKYGRVINVSDIDYLGWSGKLNCSATKAASFGLTRSLALEAAKDNVTINCLVKGDVAESDMSKDESDKIASRLPVQKIGKPEDIAGAVCFFASEKAKYITGQTLFVCGGKSLYSSMSV